MVRFLSINFFSWISSIFVGFFKGSHFYVSPCRWLSGMQCCTLFNSVCITRLVKFDIDSNIKRKINYKRCSVRRNCLYLNDDKLVICTALTSSEIMLCLERESGVLPKHKARLLMKAGAIMNPEI